MFLKLCLILLTFFSLSSCDYSTFCTVTNPNSNSQSHISLYDELKRCGATYHVDIPTKHTCINLEESNRAHWALSISTHDTCVTAWYNYDCTKPSIKLEPTDGNFHWDLSRMNVAEKPEKTWKNNIGSLSRCDYEKKCKLTSPKTNSQSHISLFNKLHHCGVTYHVDIPTKHTCVNLIKSNMSDWALSLSTHETCVTAWYNYDCTGPSIDLIPSDIDSHSDLSGIAVAGESGETWGKNIGSLSRCDYERKCHVTNPDSNSQTNISLFEKFKQCEVSYNVDITNRHTCVKLKTSSKSKWALSISLGATCVTSWLNNDCTGPSVQLNLDNGNSDLSQTTAAGKSDKSWKKNIGSLSRCDYEKKCEVTNPLPDSQSHISLFDDLNQCGVIYHVDIPTNQTCVNLNPSGKSDWALSVSTHGTCVMAWYNNDCSGLSIQLNLDNGNLHSDLSQIALTRKSKNSWKKNIGSLSRCEYKKCKVANPNSNSESHISLYAELNYCGEQHHVVIPTNHNCMNLKTSNKSDWALSISTHDTCVKAWYNYDCTEQSIQLEPNDGNSHSDLSSVAVEGKSDESWKKNIGSLSRCDYTNKCEVINPMPDSQSHITLFDKLNHCGEQHHVNIPTNQTCVNLKTSGKSDWAVSIHTHYTCVTAWNNYNCTGSSIQLKPDDGNLHEDLYGIYLAIEKGTSWKENIGSLSRCDYKKMQDNKKESTTMNDIGKESTKMNDIGNESATMKNIEKESTTMQDNEGDSTTNQDNQIVSLE